MRMHAVILEVVYYSSKFSWHKADEYSGGGVSLGRILTGMKREKRETDFNFIICSKIHSLLEFHL